MKTHILILLSAFLVSGCSFGPPKYDNNEYFFFAEIETHARFLNEECDNPPVAKKRIELMMFRSETLQTYSYFLPQNSELFGVSKIINEQLREIRARYLGEKPPSVVYCKLKTKTLIEEVHRILTTAGQLE